MEMLLLLLTAVHTLFIFLQFSPKILFVVSDPIQNSIFYLLAMLTQAVPLSQTEMGILTNCCRLRVDSLENEKCTGQQSLVGPHSFVGKPTRLSQGRAKKDSLWDLARRGAVTIVKYSQSIVHKRRPTLQGKDCRGLFSLWKDIYLPPATSSLPG